MTSRQWLLLLLLAAVWGASYLFIKVGLTAVSPAAVVFVRTALAALVLLPIALRRDALRGLGGSLGAVVSLAAVQVAGPFLLISFGELEISSSLAGILVASAPIFTALLAIWIDHEERSGGARLVGVMVGIVGVAVLLGVDVGGDAGALLGSGAVLLAGAGYAVGGFMVKRRFSGAQPIGLATGTMAASAIMLAPLAALGAPSAFPGLAASGALLALGVGGTGLAFLVFYTLIGEAGPARASIVAYVAPGFAVVYGVVLLGERVTPGTLAGLALILLGSWLAAGGGFRRSGPVRRRASPTQARAAS